MKIKETIQENRNNNAREKNQRAQEIYHMYQHAKFNRNVAQTYYN